MDPRGPSEDLDAQPGRPYIITYKQLTQLEVRYAQARNIPWKMKREAGSHHQRQVIQVFLTR